MKVFIIVVILIVTPRGFLPEEVVMAAFLAFLPLPVKLIIYNMAA